jgi:hypothetical protein
MRSDVVFWGGASGDDAVARAVKEAGWAGIYTQFVSATEKQSLTVPVTPEQVRKFYELARKAGAAEEREACAKVCDAAAKKMDDEGEGPTGCIAWVTDCASAIRARSNI